MGELWQFFEYQIHCSIDFQFELWNCCCKIQMRLTFQVLACWTKISKGLLGFIEFSAFALTLSLFVPHVIWPFDQVIIWDKIKIVNTHIFNFLNHSLLLYLASAGILRVTSNLKFIILTLRFRERKPTRYNFLCQPS